jgi:hypothetical protein
MLGKYALNTPEAKLEFARIMSALPDDPPLVRTPEKKVERVKETPE